MRKLVLTMAALGAIGITVPAYADSTVIIHKHRPLYNEMVPPPPVVVHPHRDDKTVIIKKHDD